MEISKDYVEFNHFKEENKLNFFFNKPFNPGEFVEKVKIVSQSIEQPKQNFTEKYFKIKLQHYAKYSTSSDQVFLKLFDEKFIKIIDANENKTAETDLIQHYLQKGVEYVYLSPDAFKSFLQQSGDQLKKRLLEQNRDIDIVEVAGLNFNISLTGLNDVGIDNEQINLVNDVIEKSVDDLFNDEFIEQKLQDISKNYNKIISHSFVTMYLANAIVKKTTLPWSQTMKKLSIACLFHDIALDDEIHAVQDIYPEMITDYKIQRKLLEHPVKASEVLKNSNEVFEDARKIVLEHHELPNGQGYPKKLNANQISPLSCIFIIAHQLALNLMRQNYDKEKLKSFLLNIKEEYSQGNFAKYYQAATQAFIN